VADLNTVLGAILRDVAQARVMSDLFSRNVSVEYQQDAVLRAFPVPRIDVVQATIDLRFAVSGIEQRPTDKGAIVRNQAAPYATVLARQLYAELIEDNPRRQELGEVIARKGLTIEASLPMRLERVIADNVRDVEAAIDGRPEELVRKLQAEAARLVLADDDLKEVLTRGTRVTDVRQRVESVAAASVDALAREVGPVGPLEGEEPGAKPVPRAAVARAARSLGRALFEELVVASPRRTELERVLTEKGIQLERQLVEEAERVIVEDPRALEVALEGRPEALVESLERTLANVVLTEGVRDVLTRGVRVTDLRTQVATTIASTVPAFAKQVGVAIRAAEAGGGTAVTVAVTTGELSDVPENAVSTISVVSQIRNYEWVDAGTEGVPAPKLQPE
jgi:hypothetical protein